MAPLLLLEEVLLVLVLVLVLVVVGLVLVLVLLLPIHMFTFMGIKFPASGGTSGKSFDNSRQGEDMTAGLPSSSTSMSCVVR